MSETEIRQFYTQGFLGPFDAFSHDEMMDFKREVLALEKRSRKTYGWVTPRDRHFESPRLWNYMKYPAITERCAQMLGPDLLVWRSQYFYKGPKSPAIQWHQASTFMVEDYQDPGIFPPDRSEIFQLTVWVAIDDATPERGCLRFARGAHDRVRTIKFGGEEGFYNAAYTLDFDEEGRRLRAAAGEGRPVHHLHRAVHPRLGPEHDRPPSAGVQHAGDSDARAGLHEQEVLPQRVQRRQVQPRQVGRGPAAWRRPPASEPGDSAGGPGNGRVHARDSAGRAVAGGATKSGA